MTTIPTEARNATLQDLAELLKAQQAVKLDATIPATAIRSVNGILRIEGMGTKLEAANVDALLAGGSNQGYFRPTSIMDGQIAEKLGIPGQYLRKLREQRPDLYDANVNGWLHGHTHPNIQQVPDAADLHDPDDRRFTVRTFMDPEGGEGVGRALLSNGFGFIDHFDPLFAALDVIRQLDPDARVIRCNLSERRMFVHVASPTVQFHAPQLFKDYRSPIEPSWRPEGMPPRVGDLMFGGWILANSETGHGKFIIVPAAMALACTNGMQVTREAVSRIHLGARMSEGVIDWSEETRKKNVELVASMTRDALTRFMSDDFWQEVIADVERKAGVQLADPQKTIDVISKQLSIGDDVQKLVLDHFVRGGQMTAGGIFQAITSAAQVVSSPDLSYDLEAQALKALDLAAAGR